MNCNGERKLVSLCNKIKQPNSRIYSKWSIFYIFILIFLTFNCQNNKPLFAIKLLTKCDAFFLLLCINNQERFIMTNYAYNTYCFLFEPGLSMILRLDLHVSSGGSRKSN